MDVINYNNYLTDKTDSKYNCSVAITDLSRSRQNDNREFIYTITPEENEIRSQAELFANYAAATGLFEGSFLNNANRIDQAYELIKDSYTYSYIKSIFYAFGLTLNSSFSIMGPASNLVYYGHKLLYDIIIEGYIQEFSYPSNVISVQLNVDNKVIDDLKKFSIWEDIYDKSSGRVFNRTLETVLNFCANKTQNTIKVGNIGLNVDKSVQTLRLLPLGNMVYSNDMQQLLYIENQALLNDRDSYYWGKACMISALEIPSIDADDEIYDTVLASKYDVTGRTFEVRSITGFNPLSGPRSAFDVTRSPSYDDTMGSGPSTYSRDNSRRTVKPNQNPRSKDTKLTATKTRLFKLTGDAVNFIRQADQVLTPDRLDIVSQIIEQITGKKPKLRELRALLGRRIGNVLDGAGVSVTDMIVGSEEEYDAFYGDSYYSNGRWNTELVGMPKRITQK